MPPRPLFLLGLALPTTAAILLTTYLHNSPLSSQKTRSIKTSRSLSPTCSLSPSLRIINPRSHISCPDSRLITLSKREIGNLTDEEILARFVRGFYSGWVFYPEKGIISLFRVFGRAMIACGFEGVPMDGPQLLDPNDISRSKIPEKFTVLLNGNFMVLDSYLRNGEEGEGEMPSFIEIGFGDNRKGFAGMHRFEVLRDVKSMKEEGQEDGGEEGVQLWYSSISCNPTENKLPFPGWVFNFHEFYAQCLFRDGVAGVLRN